MFALKLQRVYTSAFLFHLSKNWVSKIKTLCNFTAMAIFKMIDTKENRVRCDGIEWTDRHEQENKRAL